MMALLKFAGMARSTYYYHLKQMEKPDKHSVLKSEILLIFNENKGRYGYRRITLELRNRKIVANHKLVRKLMNELNLKAEIKKRKYKSYRGDIGEAAPNVINRDFKAGKPNLKWTTDISEFSIPAGKLYLSPILDMFNGEIVSYSLEQSPTFYCTMSMLKKALNKTKETSGLIIHSDQGWQYRMREYQKTLTQNGIIQSMSRKGNCFDNAIMENFFGLIKKEMFYGNEFKYKTLTELALDIKDYINYYNNRRIKFKLNGLSPIQYRKQSLMA